jgi:hypothetical protein
MNLTDYDLKNEDWEEICFDWSNSDILRLMNIFLKYLNCIPFTVIEVNTIKLS